MICVCCVKATALKLDIRDEIFDFVFFDQPVYDESGFRVCHATRHVPRNYTVSCDQKVRILARALLEDDAEDDFLSALIDSRVVIHDEERMTPGMKRYWYKFADSDYIKANNVSVIDPWCNPLWVLRHHYAPGTVIYRASPGGKYGKSASIDRL